MKEFNAICSKHNDKRFTLKKGKDKMMKYLKLLTYFVS